MLGPPDPKLVLLLEINAFTRDPAGGNPASVCLLDGWPSDEALRKIGMQSGPSVTAFAVNRGGDLYDLRWFTRGGLEVDSFCGHATFAAGHALAENNPARSRFVFDAVSGRFVMTRKSNGLAMRGPAWLSEPALAPLALLQSLNREPTRTMRSERDWLLEFGSVEELEALEPDYALMRGVGDSADIGVIALAPVNDHMVAFRFFCPGFSIGEDEDPATGSALSTLAPYWSAVAGLDQFEARQLSARGGDFSCRVSRDEVETVASGVTVDCRWFQLY